MSSSNENTLQLENSNFNLPLRIEDFSCDKFFKGFIKNVERMVRFSTEYKFWVSYLVENCDNHLCAISKETISECSIDIHHHPISLYTIVKAVIEKEINDQNKFCTFDIATNIIELHFQNKIGYIPLLSDLHQKFHNGFLQIPIDLVKGDYQFILDNYEIDDNDFKHITQLQTIKKADCTVPWSKDNYPGINSLVA